MEAGARSVSLERLEQILPAAYDNYQMLVPALDLMVHLRIETLAQLNRIADALDRRHRDGNLVKAAGSATGVVGSATAAVGLALTPVTMGFGLVIMAGGGILASIGSFTALGAHVTEKMYEKIDLEKVQEAIDKDKRQCEVVKGLWKEFEGLCNDAINTIALADPSQETDILSLQTWAQVALEEVIHPVVLIAEAFESLFSRVTGNILAHQDGGNLCDVLGKTACAMISDPKKLLRSVVSRLKVSLTKFGGTLAFMVIAGVFLGNLITLVMTLIDIHKGSPSKVALELRDKSFQLQKELNYWLDAFGKTGSG